MIRKSEHLIMFLAVCSVGILIVVSVFIYSARSSPPALFRRVVVDPIPRSVRNIRAHRHRRPDPGWEMHTYVLRFEVSNEDLSRIVTSGGFTQLADVEYSLGGIVYQMTDRCYSSFRLHVREDWFDLEQWRDFEGYIVEQERPNSWYKARLLLHNEQARTAYFMEHERRGEWTGILSVTDPRRGEDHGNLPSVVY